MLAGSIPTEFGKLINLTGLDLADNKLSGTPPFAHVAWFGKRGTKRPSTGHLLKTTFHWPFAENDLPPARCTYNQASFFADILPGLVVPGYSTSLPLAYYELPEVVVVVVVVVVAAVAAGASGVASGVASHGASKDLHRRTSVSCRTWRTGQEEFKVFMKEEVPTCNVYV